VEVLLIEDHGLVREGLRLLLEGMGLFSRCHEARDLAEALRILAARGDAVGLILLDLGLPDAERLDAIDAVLAAQPRCKVVVCSGERSPERIRACFARGAVGYVTKNSSGPALQAALHAVLRGERHVPEEVLVDAAGDSAPAGRASDGPTALTPRQREVLRLLARGLANKEIAAELGMSPATVRAHLSSVFKLLRVENRTQAATSPQAVSLLED
jgi:DNA-binding NarL/FixJ family response regulator